MAGSLKALLRLLLPPVVLLAWRTLRRPFAKPEPPPPPPEWEYVPQGWEYPVRGWNDRSIAEKQASGWDDFINTLAAPRPVGCSVQASRAVPSHHSQHNMFMSFAYVVARAAEGADGVTILDWGGGLGQYYHVARNLYPRLKFNYTCKELKFLADAGGRLTPEIRFTESAIAAASQRYDLVFASGVLQYVVDFESELDQLCSAAGNWFMLARVPLVDEGDRFVVLQRPYHYGYETEYLCWVFNRAQLISALQNRGFRLEREFLLDSRIPVQPPSASPETVVYMGSFLFRRLPADAI